MSMVENEETNNSSPAIRESSGRNPDGTFKPGVSGNPSGRPKGTMKDYLKRKFNEMSDDEKEEFLRRTGVSGKAQIEFAEGRATQEMDIDATLTGPALLRIDE